ELFYQTSPGQLEDAVATHHAAGSWKSVESYRRAVKLAEQRNYELRGRIEELERELARKRSFLRRCSRRPPREVPVDVGTPLRVGIAARRRPLEASTRPEARRAQQVP